MLTRFLPGIIAGNQPGEMTTRLIQALLNDRAYDHDTRDIHVIETHISWVICTGSYVYKIKKPVDLGFLDFSSLDKRRYYCHEELRLNQILAPELYLDVVAITGTPEHPHMAGHGTAIEYAVKLKQFDTACQFDRLLADSKLDEHHIDEVVDTIVRFHENTPRLKHSENGFANTAHKPVRENYRQADRYKLTMDQRERVNKLRQWHDAAFARLSPIIEQRLADGYVRECHGDLHLGNIVYYQNKVILFDRLEFDPQLRFIDVINEIAFLLMDLEAHRQQGLAHRFLSAWLQRSGDYAGLYLLDYYKCYRSMVRAKVALIQGSEAEFLRYLALAETCTRERFAALILTHGLSGSGKSTITRPLAPLINAIIVRSDIERKRHLQGVSPDLYGTEATRQTYSLLATAAEAIIGTGYHAIVDATFLKAQQRQLFMDLAQRLKRPCIILDFQAPRELLVHWINERMEKGTDVSDATVEILDQQIRNQEPLTEYEQQHALTVDTSQNIEIADLASAVMSYIDPHR